MLNSESVVEIELNKEENFIWAKAYNSTESEFLISEGFRLVYQKHKSYFGPLLFVKTNEDIKNDKKNQN